MQNITFLRTSIDKLLNNAIVRTIVSMVNFCKEQSDFYHKELKFYQNMPLNSIVKQKSENYFTPQRYVFTTLKRQ